MIKLRNYQFNLLQDVKECFDAQEQVVMAQLPTGAGKTEIGIKLVEEYLHNSKQVVWLTHKQELCYQTYRRFIDNNLTAYYYTSNNKAKPCAESWRQGVQILSPMMYRNAIKKGTVPAPSDVSNEFGLLVVDEAHHSTSKIWREIIQQWSGNVLGMTATPWRLEKNKGFEHIFDSLLPGPQILDLTPEYLAPVRLIMPIEEAMIERKNIPIRTNGEFDLRLFDSNPFTLAIRCWHEQQKIHNYKQTILYLPTLRSARRASVYIKQNLGMDVGLLLSDVELDELEKELGGVAPAAAGVVTDRTECIELFKDGKLDCIVNCEIITEGLDCPGADCIVILRPTKSLTLYLQMVGRGTRTAENKDYLALFDFAQNYNEFGMPDQNRQWSLKPRGVVKGEAPIKICMNCKTICAPGVHNCPWCEYSFGQECVSCGWVSWSSWRHQNENSLCPICTTNELNSCDNTQCPIKKLNYSMLGRCIVCDDTKKNHYIRFCDKCLHGEIFNLQTIDLLVWKKNNNKLIYKKNVWQAVVLQRQSGDWRYVILNLKNDVIKKSAAYDTQFNACKNAEEAVNNLISKKKYRQENRVRAKEESYANLLALYR